MNIETQEIRNFFSIAHTKITLVEEVNNIYGKELAPNFNSFDFWSIDENKVSEIIAYFLDPNQKHQQGDIYLRHFIKKFKLDFFNFDGNDKILVKCEKKTKNGRFIDIFISKNNNEKLIAIENKIHVGTSDQKNQIIDYINFLNVTAEDSFCLMYLSPKGKSLSEESISEDDRQIYEADGRLIIKNYEDEMIECVSGFSTITENPRVKSFLKDFEKKLRKIYMGEKNINSKEVIKDYIIENGKNLVLAFEVSNSLHAVKEHLKSVFENELKEIADELKIKYDNYSFFPSNWTKHRIRFNYELNGIIYGVGRNTRDTNKSKLPDIQVYLEEKLKEDFKTTELWPLYQHFYKNTETNQSFWIDVINGKAKERAKNFVNLINENFNSEIY